MIQGKSRRFTSHRRFMLYNAISISQPSIPFFPFGSFALKISIREWFISRMRRMAVVVFVIGVVIGVGLWCQKDILYWILLLLGWNIYKNNSIYQSSFPFISIPLRRKQFLLQLLILHWVYYIVTIILMERRSSEGARTNKESMHIHLSLEV